MAPDDIEHPVMAIDHGDARMGIAATDLVGIMAHPVETIHVQSCDVIERIAELAAQRQVKNIVVGLPLRMDGTEGTSALKVRKFTNQVKRRLPDIPFHYCDETLTTVAANEKLLEAGIKGKRGASKHKELIDQAAAMEILNNWLGWY
ncbi:MAG: Holliday junction resolvase RuvX [Akkermansiaceae bacterium]